MGGIGVPAEQSWESWWEAEQEHLRHSGKFVTVVEILLALRFFIYQYGLVYHLTITEKTNNVLAIPIGRQKFSAMSRWMFRFIEWVLFVTFIAILVILITVAHMTIQDIFVCILAFIPTSWGMLLIAQACQPVVHRAGFGFWGLVRTLARCCSRQWRSWLGFQLCRSSKRVCSSIQISVEVFRSLVSLEETGRIE